MKGAYALAFFCGLLTILVEIVLARALDFSLNSFVSWMCISGAMFGIGLGGLLFDWKPRAGRWIWALLGLVLLLLPVVHNQLSLDGGDSWSALNYAILMAMLCAPFALISWALMQVFALPKVNGGYIYFFDLVGGGLGAGVAYFLLGPLSPGQILAIAGLGCFGLTFSGRKQVAAFAVAALGAYFLYNVTPPGFEFRAKSDKRYSVLLKSAVPERTLWTPGGKLDVVSVAGGWKHILYDGGEMLTTIFPFSGNYNQLKGQLRERLFTDFWNPGVIAPHYLKDGSGSRVLAVGAAGGQEIKAALLFGAREVEVAEVIGELLELGKTDYALFNGGIFLRPEVAVFARDGRAHLRHQREKIYDIIQLNSVHGSSSRGSSMGALQTTPLVTVEAFSEYFSHLSPDGILHLSHPYYPRLITTMAEAWKGLGRVDFRQHVIVVQSVHESDFLTNTLVKMSPWTDLEVARLQELFQITGSVNDNYEMVENPRTHGRIPDELFDGRWASIAGELPYRIFPATDDQPYFKFLRQIPVLPEIHQHSAITPDIDNYLFRWRTRELPGDVFPLVMLGAGVAAVSLMIFLMGLVRFDLSAKKWTKAAYFFLTGFSFMALETFFIYRATLWLGSPHRALAVGLGVLLIFAGIGGATVRFGPARSCLIAALASLLAARVGIGGSIFISLVVSGFVMGMPFVAGLRSITRPGQERSGAFLISGLGAGIGGYCAVLGSLIWSFPAVLFVGCFGYACAAVLSRFSRV